MDRRNFLKSFGAAGSAAFTTNIFIFKHIQPQWKKQNGIFTGYFDGISQGTLTLTSFNKYIEETQKEIYKSLMLSSKIVPFPFVISSGMAMQIQAEITFKKGLTKILKRSKV